MHHARYVVTIEVRIDTMTRSLDAIKRQLDPVLPKTGVEDIYLQ